MKCTATFFIKSNHRCEDWFLPLHDKELMDAQRKDYNEVIGEKDSSVVMLTMSFDVDKKFTEEWARVSNFLFLYFWFDFVCWSFVRIDRIGIDCQNIPLRFNCSEVILLWKFLAHVIKRCYTQPLPLLLSSLKGDWSQRYPEGFAFERGKYSAWEEEHLKQIRNEVFEVIAHNLHLHMRWEILLTLIGPFHNSMWTSTNYWMEGLQ